MPTVQRDLLEELKKWVDRREILAVKGPRQAGKTTLLKLLEEWLVHEKGADERNLALVTSEGRGELDAFTENPKDFVRGRLAPKGRTYLLLDEAQYAPDAGQKLKLVYDLFGDALKLIISGSSSL